MVKRNRSANWWKKYYYGKNHAKILLQKSIRNAREEVKKQNSILAKEYRAKNREKLKQKSSEWYYKNYKQKLYSLSEEEYKKLLEKQNGKCAICFCEGKTLCIDHDHKTKKVRGLLCHSCNMGLGFFHDNIDILQNAKEYAKTTGISE